MMLSSAKLAAKMPAGLNKNSAFYKALFGNVAAKPSDTITLSSHFNEGAIANELDFLKLFIAKLAGIKDIRQLEAPYLDYLVELAIGSVRFLNESNQSFLNRVLALTERKYNPRRTTLEAISDFFKYFYQQVYVIENNIETNLVQNAAFKEGLNSWQLTSEVYLQDGFDAAAELAAVVGANYVKLLPQSSIRQQLRLGSSVNNCYLLYFFVKGGVTITLTNQAGWYYSFSEQTWLATQASLAVKNAGTDWQLFKTYFKANSNDTIELKLGGNSADFAGLDYINCGPYLGYPSFKVLLKADSYDDLNPQGFFNQNVFFNQDFFLAGDNKGISKNFFTIMLNTIKPTGVKASYELV